jgi:hypothetical protein
MGGLKKIEKGFGKVWLPVRKVIDPLNIMDPFNILPDAKLRGKKPFSFDSEYGGVLGNALRGPTTPYTPPRMNMPQYQAPDNSGMMNSLLAQQQQGIQESSKQKADELASANAQQQQNINAAMQNSKQNLNNSLMRTPVPSTFSKITPVSTSQFKFPNVAGLTFGK